MQRIVYNYIREINKKKTRDPINMLSYSYKTKNDKDGDLLCIIVYYNLMKSAVKDWKKS